MYSVCMVMSCVHVCAFSESKESIISWRYVSAEDSREANATRILNRITSCSTRPRLVNGRDVTGLPSRTHKHNTNTHGGVYKGRIPNGVALYPIIPSIAAASTIHAELALGWMDVMCEAHNHGVVVVRGWLSNARHHASILSIG